jgi:hypothetical protein
MGSKKGIIKKEFTKEEDDLIISFLKTADGTMQSKMKEVAIKVSRSYHSICNRYYDYYKFKLNKKQDEII